MSTQTQLRRGTFAQCQAMTPAVGEVIVDTTNWRLFIGDGSTVGGLPMANAHDVQNQYFNYAADTGGVNTLLAAPVFPIQGNAAGVAVEVKALNTITGPSTLGVSGFTALAIKKIVSGALADVAAGDIVAGVIYRFTCNGTFWQLIGVAGSGLIKRSGLDTSQGSSSVAGLGSGSASTVIVLPGGEYGFYPNFERPSYSSAPGTTQVMFPDGSSVFSYQARILVNQQAASSGSPRDAPPMNVNQRYINASPPYELDDGQVAGFLYMLLGKNDEFLAHYLADAPPWAYNGPTNICPDFIDPATGKKFKRVRKNTVKQIMNGAEPKWMLQEICSKMVNKDMDLIPQPFESSNKDARVVLVNPYDDRVRKLLELQHSGDNEAVLEIIQKGYIKCEHEPMREKSPSGVHMCRMKYDYGKK